MANRIDCLGRAIVGNLSAKAGGLSLLVPNQYTDDLALTALLGPDLSALLIDNFSGERIYIPRGPSLHNSSANPLPVSKIARLTRSNLSNRAIAIELKCSERAIEKIRARQRVIGK